MWERTVIDELIDVSLSMFRKNFLGIFHGSLSAKLEEDHFLINKRESIFDEMRNDDFIELYAKRDYRWKQASIDAEIHNNIYKYVSHAKYVAYTMPPYTTAYSLDITHITPKDYFGYQAFRELEIYDPGNFDTWYERAPNEVYRYFKQNNRKIMVIKGYGVYTCHRDLPTLVKNIAILENSCRLLHFSQEHHSGRKNYTLR